METKNAAAKTRKCFIDNERKLTLSDIKVITGLAAPAVSMSVNYLLRQKYLTREQIDNPSPFGRRKVWLYQYHPQRLVG